MAYILHFSNPLTFSTSRVRPELTLAGVAINLFSIRNCIVWSKAMRSAFRETLLPNLPWHYCLSRWNSSTQDTRRPTGTCLAAGAGAVEHVGRDAQLARGGGVGLAYRWQQCGGSCMAECSSGSDCSSGMLMAGCDSWLPLLIRQLPARPPAVGVAAPFSPDLQRLSRLAACCAQGSTTTADSALLHCSGAQVRQVCISLRVALHAVHTGA